jgi:6-phosphogluconate dehydrogenase
MNLNHLTDNELIDHIIKYDEDPIRVRLATHMQRVHGAIIDDLVRAGMDDVWCTFRSVVNEGEYHSGDYIRHLENEIEYLHNEANQNLKEIKNLQARTIMDVFAELKQEIKTAEYSKEIAIKERQAAERKEEEMRHKLDMWTILKR